MSDLDLVVRSWGFALLGAGLLAVAFLVNRFAAAKRRRLRSTLLLYGVFLSAFTVSQVLGHVHAGGVVSSWAEHIGLVRDSFAAFTLVALSR